MNCAIEIPSNTRSGDIVVLGKNTPFHYKGDYIAVHIIRKSRGRSYIANGTNYGDASKCNLHNKVKVIQLKG